LGRCAGVLTGAAGRAPASVAIDPPRRAGMPLVVVAMPDSPAFQAVRRTLVSELKKDFDVSTLVIDARTTDSQFRDDLEDSGASAVVLMDNRTIKLYRAYQASHAAGAAFIPAVVTMSSFLEELHPQLPASTGVAYEVPGVTAFVRLRDIVKTPVRRVGVIHRPVFHDFIERQKILAAKEQIDLVAIAVSANPDPKEVQLALRQLKTGPPVDALWILNDNRLLPSGEFLETAWRAGAAALDVPVIVGIAALVSEDAHFGTFAVVPDLDALGVQTANLVFELADRHWNADGLPVELPVSTVTVGNLRQLRQRFGLRDGALQRIDRTVE
jgi:putative ABC transport system substrate-binding protein